ncbi:lipase family protein [Isoalcanivorax indicus]|uniref:lipase family protein n=1 Tax=Isoalcanivorax indicus TaxID=2202653 RepID=UPI000DB9D54D|nr:lipase family protein [Isoalcanivorax indicus]
MIDATRIDTRRTRGRLTVLLTALLTALATIVISGPLIAVADDWYQPPVPLPAGEPGDIIKTREVNAGPPSARAMARAWQVMYRSTDALGEANAVTGTLVVPRAGDPGSMPLIGMGPGTHGPAARCAPSRMIDKGAFYEQATLNDMLQRGYAVLVTDYEGYHPDPATTYMVGRSMGAALINGVRAAQRFPEAGLSDLAPVLFRGYSQGGGAAMWAGQMQPDYAPTLNLVGVAGGGVPANLAAVALPLNGEPGFGVMFYALLGQDHAYPELSLAPFVNQAGMAALQAMQEDMCVLELLQGFAGITLDDLTDINPLNAERFNRIAENQLGDQPIAVPVYLYHEQQDSLVAYGQAQTLRDDYCALGVDVTWQSHDTGGDTGVIRHLNLVYHGNEGVNAFIEQRLAGQLPASHCFP